MRHETISHSHLLPIQEYLDTQKVRRLAQLSIPLPPVIALPYGSYRFLIVDGHHRAAALRLRGKNAVDSTIIETDDDLRMAHHGACYRAVEGIVGILDTYEREWRPICATRGVDSFHDLLLITGLA